MNIKTSGTASASKAAGGKLVCFLADETDDADLNTLFEYCGKLKIYGYRAHPRDISIAAGSSGLKVYQGKELLEADLVVGWVFEKYLSLGIVILESMRLAGFKVVNRPETLLFGQNKASMTAQLTANNIPHPPTLIEIEGHKLSGLELLSYPVVVKPGFVNLPEQVICSSGSGVSTIQNEASMRSLVEILRPYGAPIYCQEFCKPHGTDEFRAYVFGFKNVCTYKRQLTGPEWRANTDFGSASIPYVADDDMITLSVAAAQAVNAPIAGVDLVRLPDGQLVVLEVNTCPTFIHPVSGVHMDVVEAFARYLAGELDLSILPERMTTCDEKSTYTITCNKSTREH